MRHVTFFCRQKCGTPHKKTCTTIQSQNKEYYGVYNKGELRACMSACIELYIYVYTPVFIHRHRYITLSVGSQKKVRVHKKTGNGTKTEKSQRRSRSTSVLCACLHVLLMLWWDEFRNINVIIVITLQTFSYLNHNLRQLQFCLFWMNSALCLFQGLKQSSRYRSVKYRVLTEWLCSVMV